MKRTSKVFGFWCAQDIFLSSQESNVLCVHLISVMYRKPIPEIQVVEYLLRCHSQCMLRELIFTLLASLSVSYLMHTGKYLVHKIYFVVLT